jgi:hypothetical protein
MYSAYYFVQRDRLEQYVADGQPIGRMSAIESDEPGMLFIMATFHEHNDADTFIAHTEAEPMEKPLTRKSVGKAHASRLARFGVAESHTTFEVSDKVEKIAGKFMRLPNY